MKRKNAIRWTGLFLSAVLLMAAPAPMLTSASAATVNELESKYDQLEEQQKQAKAELEKAKAGKNESIEIQQQINNQIDITVEQISVLGEKITALEDDIAEKEEEIVEKQAEIDENMQLYKKRLRAMYMASETSKLELLLGAGSFSDFLTRTDTVMRIAQHDTALTQKLENDKAALERAKEELNEDKISLEESKATVDAKKKQLDSQYAENANQIARLEDLEAKFMSDVEKYKKEMQQVQAEIDWIYSQMQTAETYVGGEFTWPLPGYSQISSSYGSRFGGADFHTGTDITGSGVFGANIVAANSGTVKVVQLTYTQGVGYGKYLIIDHGGGYTTLYAHTSEILVSVGQQVTKGQVIARVGSTGWSTGPHLHFEVRINGGAVNAMQYFTKA